MIEVMMRNRAVPRPKENQQSSAFAILFIMGLLHTGVSLVAQVVKNLPAMQETLVRPLGGDDALEKTRATHSSVLAWRTPWTGGPDRPYSSCSAESDMTE